MSRDCDDCGQTYCRHIDALLTKRGLAEGQAKIARNRAEAEAARLREEAIRREQDRAIEVDAAHGAGAIQGFATADRERRDRASEVVEAARWLVMWTHKLTGTTATSKRPRVMWHEARAFTRLRSAMSRYDSGDAARWCPCKAEPCTCQDFGEPVSPSSPGDAAPGCPDCRGEDGACCQPCRCEGKR